MIRRLILPLLLIAGCAAKKPAAPAATVNYLHELPPGTLALRKLAPADYPSFAKATSAGNLQALLGSIDHSLAYLAKPVSQKFFPYEDISHDRAVATLTALRHLIDVEIHQPPGRRRGPGWTRRFIRTSRSTKVWAGTIRRRTSTPRDVLFTGYCTPTYNASRTRTGPFQWPLYRRPADLLDPPANPAPGAANARRRMPDGSAGPAGPCASATGRPMTNDVSPACPDPAMALRHGGVHPSRRSSPIDALPLLLGLLEVCIYASVAGLLTVAPGSRR